eukprot:Blabericola_migrator_1__3042@NODE_1885_length_3606_cov_196_697937_g1207_i0_p4_GENE_NODE_1885_length_3606_cov_196_697937_g1207_i0NODE_1885_length_3606_cov_196_697937_g1207_i0_p4_ORF_typecomplete_len120_score2_67_NODE_1885_length_3606_cov_196_697937_g1207_i011411500
MRPSTKTGDLQSPPAHNDIRTQTTPRLDHRHWNSPRPHIHQPTLVMPLPGDPPPREWVTLIDFSALRRYEGKVILVDSTLESPSSYTPVSSALKCKTLLTEMARHASTRPVAHRCGSFL